MNKDKLNKLFNDFLIKIDKLESMKSKYQNWYDDDRAKLLWDDIKAACAELESDLANMIDNLVFGEDHDKE